MDFVSLAPGHLVFNLKKHRRDCRGEPYPLGGGLGLYLTIGGTGSVIRLVVGHERLSSFGFVKCLLGQFLLASAFDNVENAVVLRVAQRETKGTQSP